MSTEPTDDAGSRPAPDRLPPASADSLLRAFLAVALVEAVSYIALISASVAHRAFGAENLVPYVGLVHGVIFLVYFALAWRLRGIWRWDNGTMIVIVVASVVPIGTVFVERRIARHHVNPNLLHGWVLRP